MSYYARIIDYGPDWKAGGRPSRYTLARIDEWDDGTFSVSGDEHSCPSWWRVQDAECDSLDDIVDGEMRL